MQKIDKIKAQLTAIADLIKPSTFSMGDMDSSAVEDDLDQDELHILREAGIICGTRLKGKGNKPKHIVFVEDEQEGVHCILIFTYNGPY
jgi:U3 small nucleolar RNA-associated protein 11